MEVKILEIQKLANQIDGPDGFQCGAYGNRCAIALEAEEHNPGVILNVAGDHEKIFNIQWVSPAERSGYREPKKNVELGAVAISFLLTKEFTEYSFFTEGFQGEGIDYWLGYPEGHEKYDELNFMNARLEISGIKKESATNKVDKRVKEKLGQTKPTDKTLTEAYITVVEFNSPKAIFKKK